MKLDYFLSWPSIPNLQPYFKTSPTFHYRYVIWPASVEDRMKLSRVFFKKHGKKGLVMGLIDGTHIPIVSPKKEREPPFVNRKGYHSLNTTVS